MKQTRKDRCTKDTILEEQKRLKEEPNMINVKTWIYVVEQKEEKKQDYKKKKSTHKKQSRNVK